MFGGLSVVISFVVGVVSLAVTGIFGGVERELVQETVEAGETISVTVDVPALSATPEGQGDTVGMPSPTPGAVVGSTTIEINSSPEPTVVEVESSEDESCVTEQLEDGHRIVCESGEDGTAHVEATIERDNANVQFRQNINSSSSVKSHATLNISTED